MTRLERDERSAPCDLEGERDLLAACVGHPNGMALALPLVDASDFSSRLHRAIWTGLVTVYGRGEGLDFSSVLRQLETMAAKPEHQATLGAKDFGAGGYLTGLLANVPSYLHVEHYARRVRDTGTLRRLLQAAGQVAAAAYDHADDAAAAVDAAETALLQALQRRYTQSFTSLSDLTQAYLTRLEAIAQGRLVEGLPCGLPDLDKLTGGLHAGELVIVAARPGMGKTSLAMQIAYHVAAVERRSVGVFSLEMTAEQLVHRLVSAQTGLEGLHLRTGHLSDAEWANLWAGIGPLGDVPLWIDDAPALTVLRLRAKARQLALLVGGADGAAPLGLLVVDYLQLMSGSEARSREGRVQEVSEVSRGLKALAKELQVPIIACAQLNRSVDDRPLHRPQLSDLRESGQIEGDADLVLFLVREELYAPKTERAGIADLLVAKHRSGALADLAFRFDAATTRFLPLETRHQREPDR